MGFKSISELHGQAKDTVPEVLGIPKKLDRTAVYFLDRLNSTESKKTELKKTVQDYVTLYLGLDKAKVGAMDIQFVAQKDFGPFVLHHLLFQTQEGVYVPAHLYVPKGEGPFPAVLNSHGHWANGKSGEIVQRTAQLLARNGYVCLNIDAWGAGERGTDHLHEYHGASIGSSLLDLGIPLLGMQLLDNIRAIDVLQSLPYVDSMRIAATGASGGGNQTFWITSMDSRVKASVPVVSIGTFRSYILNSNCVCELLPNGLVNLETKDLISSVAPKPIKIISALRDGNAAFNVNEMLKTFNAAKQAYQGTEERFSYELFDEKHDYTLDMQLSMLKWFDMYLGQKRNEIDTTFKRISDNDLLVLKNAEQQNKVATTLSYVSKRSREITAHLLSDTPISREQKINTLKGLINEPTERIQYVKTLPSQNNYERFVMSTESGKLLPWVQKKKGTTIKSVKIVFGSKGNKTLGDDISSKLMDGQVLIMMDLFGLGERSSAQADKIDGQLPRFHTLSRSALWLGESLMAIWVSEIETVLQYIRQQFPTGQIEITADRETAIAALLHSVLHTSNVNYRLLNLPYSYVPDYQSVANMTKDAINMSIHIQGIIQWGDIPLLLALAPAGTHVKEVIGLSGERINADTQNEWNHTVNQLKEALSREAINYNE